MNPEQHSNNSTALADPDQVLRQVSDLVDVLDQHAEALRDLASNRPASAVLVGAMARLRDRATEILSPSINVKAAGAHATFVPDEIEQQIMQVLDGRRLTTDALRNEVLCGRRQLLNRLKRLKEHRLVANNNDRKGFYRPDAPPRLK